MPLLDETSYAPVASTDLAAHKCGVVRPMDATITKHLHACTHKFAEWHGVEPNWGIGYGDFADWVLNIALGSPAGDGHLWNQNFMEPDELDKVFVAVFKHVDKQPFESLPEWLQALDIARDKCSAEEITLDTANLVECDSPNNADNSEAFEDLITWGALRTCQVGLRAAAVLERSMPHRVEWSSSPTIQAAMRLSLKHGVIDDDDGAFLDEADREDFHSEALAYGAISTLASEYTLAPALRSYVPPGPGRTLAMRAEALGARDQFNGDSAFCQERTKGMVALHAPVIGAVFAGVSDARTLNSGLLEVAAAFPSDSVPHQPKHLFTEHGVKQLAVVTAHFGAWTALDSTKALAVGPRVASFVARVRNNRLASGANGGGGGDGGGGGGGSGGGGGGGTGSAGETDGRFAGSRNVPKAVHEQIARVRERGDNPAILADLIRLMLNPDHDPKDVLEISLTGATEANPTRKSTVLSRAMAMRVIHAAVIDSRLSLLYTYSKAYGGPYLGRAVGDVLVAEGLAEKEAVKFLSLDALFEAFLGFKWKTELDFYNLLQVEIVRQVQCEGTLANVPVAGVEHSKVYADALLNARLPLLAAAAFEAMGIPHDGEGSFKAILDSSNAFVLMNGGITKSSTNGAARRDLIRLTHALSGGVARANQPPPHARAVCYAHDAPPRREHTEGWQGLRPTLPSTNPPPPLACLAQTCCAPKPICAGACSVRRRPTWTPNATSSTWRHRSPASSSAAATPKAPAAAGPNAAPTSSRRSASAPPAPSRRRCPSRSPHRGSAPSWPLGAIRTTATPPTSTSRRSSTAASAAAKLNS